jgi:hypothetical protein
MSIRRDPIYISSEVWRWLRLIAKSRPETDRETLNSGRATLSPDEVADVILRKAVEQWYPELITAVKELDKKEKEIIESLRK